MSTIFVFAIKIKLLKNYQKCFCSTKKYYFVLEIIKFLYLTFSIIFSFLGCCWFYTRSWLIISSKVYDIHVPKLDFKNTDSLISGEVKFWSWYFVNWQSFLLRKFSQRNMAVPRPILLHMSWQTILLNWFLSLQRSLRILEWGWVPKFGQAYN